MWGSLSFVAFGLRIVSLRGLFVVLSLFEEPCLVDPAFFFHVRIRVSGSLFVTGQRCFPSFACFPCRPIWGRRGHALFDTNPGSCRETQRRLVNFTVFGMFLGFLVLCFVLWGRGCKQQSDSCTIPRVGK